MLGDRSYSHPNYCCSSSTLVQHHRNIFATLLFPIASQARHRRMDLLVLVLVNCTQLDVQIVKRHALRESKTHTRSRHPKTLPIHLVQAPMQVDVDRALVAFEILMLERRRVIPLR